jgi:hypothetical protein
MVALNRADVKRQLIGSLGGSSGRVDTTAAKQRMQQWQSHIHDPKQSPRPLPASGGNYSSALKKSSSSGGVSGSGGSAGSLSPETRAATRSALAMRDALLHR